MFGPTSVIWGLAYEFQHTVQVFLRRPLNKFSGLQLAPSSPSRPSEAGHPCRCCFGGRRQQRWHRGKLNCLLRRIWRGPASRSATPLLSAFSDPVCAAVATDARATIHHGTMPPSSCKHEGQDAVQGPTSCLTAWLLTFTTCVTADSGSGTDSSASGGSANGPPAATAGPPATPGTPFQDAGTGAAATPSPPGATPDGGTAAGQADPGAGNGERKLTALRYLTHYALSNL